MLTCAFKSSHKFIIRSINTNNKNRYDIIVSGAGMVGTTFACLLAKSKFAKNLKIAIVDISDPVKLSNERNMLPSLPDIRCSAITPYTKTILDDCGAWKYITRSTPYYQMEILHAEGEGRLSFDSLQNLRHKEVQQSSTSIPDLRIPLENKPLGYIIENAIIQSALMSSYNEIMSNAPQVTHIQGSIKKVTRPKNSPIDWEDDWAHVEILDNSNEVITCSTRLLVGADGANSTVRKSLNSGCFGFDYNQVAVVATIQTKKDESSKFKKAWQRFLPTGPLALLPCHDDLFNIVWSTNVTHANRLKNISSSEFIEELNSALSFKQNLISPLSYLIPKFLSQPLPESLSSLLPILIPSRNKSDFIPPTAVVLFDKPKSFPLKFEHVETYVSKRIALIGDAAHIMHPLAGQGVNLGISDSVALVHALESGLKSGQDIGDLFVLEKYNASQRIHNHGVLGGNHLISELFINNGLFAPIRNIGLDVINSVPVVKKVLVEEATGFRKNNEAINFLTNLQLLPNFKQKL